MQIEGKIINKEFVPDRRDLWENTLSNWDGKKVVISIDTGEYVRTVKQNKALHLYFQLLADALNEAGFDIRKVVKDEIQLPWTKESVKTYLWKPAQKSMLGKDTTRLLSTTEIDKVFDAVNRIVGERTGVFVDFPSNEEL